MAAEKLSQRIGSKYPIIRYLGVGVIVITVQVLGKYMSIRLRAKNCCWFSSRVFGFRATGFRDSGLGIRV